MRRLPLLWYKNCYSDERHKVGREERFLRNDPKNTRLTWEERHKGGIPRPRRGAERPGIQPRRGEDREPPVRGAAQGLSLRGQGGKEDRRPRLQGDSGLEPARRREATADLLGVREDEREGQGCAREAGMRPGRGVLLPAPPGRPCQEIQAGLRLQEAEAWSAPAGREGERHRPRQVVFRGRRARRREGG